MASIKKECAYVECRKIFYGGKRALYCCDKCGKYQRRLNEKIGVKNVNDNHQPGKIEDA